MVYLMGFVIRNLEGKFRVYKNKKASTIIRLSMLFTGRGDWTQTHLIRLIQSKVNLIINQLFIN